MARLPMVNSDDSDGGSMRFFAWTVAIVSVLLGAFWLAGKLVLG